MKKSVPKASPKTRSNKSNNPKVKEVGAPVISPVKRKKLAMLANKKQKLVLGAQKNLPGKKVSQDESTKPPNTRSTGTEKTALEKSVIFKAFVGGFTNQTSNDDLRVALTGAGVENMEFVKVIKGRNGAHGIVGFADEDSLNEAVKLSGEVKVMNKPLKIEVMRSKAKNPGNQPKADNKKGNKNVKIGNNKVSAAEEEESKDEDDDDDDDDNDEEKEEEEENEGEEEDMDVDKPKPTPQAAKGANANGLKKRKKKNKFHAVVKNISKSCQVKQVQDSLSKSGLIVSSATEVRKGQDVHVLVSFADEDNKKKALGLKQICVNNENFAIASSLGKKKSSRGRRGGRRRGKKNNSPEKSPATTPVKNIIKVAKVKQNNPPQNKNTENKKTGSRREQNKTKHLAKATGSPQQAKRNTPKKPAMKS